MFMIYDHGCLRMSCTFIPYEKNVLLRSYLLTDESKIERSVMEIMPNFERNFESCRINHFSQRRVFIRNCPENIKLKKNQKLYFAKNQNALIFLKKFSHPQTPSINIVFVISVVVIVILFIFLKKTSKIKKIMTNSLLNFESCRNLIFEFSDLIKRSPSKPAHSNEYFRPPPCHKNCSIRIPYVHDKKMKWSMSHDTRFQKKNENSL